MYSIAKRRRKSKNFLTPTEKSIYYKYMGLLRKGAAFLFGGAITRHRLQTGQVKPEDLTTAEQLSAIAADRAIRAASELPNTARAAAQRVGESRAAAVAVGLPILLWRHTFGRRSAAAESQSPAQVEPERTSGGSAEREN